MLLGFFQTIFDNCVRLVPWGWRITIACVLFGICLLCLKLSFRKKNDKHPIAVGFFVLCVLALFLAVVYLVV